jgi:hypothetical protein
LIICHLAKNRDSIGSAAYFVAMESKILTIVDDRIITNRTGIKMDVLLMDFYS